MIIGLIHISLSIFFIYYSLYFPRKYDKYIFTFLLLIYLHWICLNGECVISFLYKKHTISKYKLGENPKELKDLDDLSKDISKYININKNIIDNIINTLLSLGMICIFYRIVKYKTIKPFFIVYLNIIFHIIFLLISKKRSYVHNNIYEKIYSIFIIISILIIHYKNK